MAKGKRLSAEERKKEIMESAAKIIIEKGFSNATMEDVISGTTMSKGGVYHYYKNTVEILRDLMLAGIDYRNEIIKEHMSEYKLEGETDFFAKRLVEKILDDNPYMPIYVQYLIEKKRNPVLDDLFESLKEETIKETKIIMEDVLKAFLNRQSMDFITNFLNGMILASDVLDARENFKENRDILEKIVAMLLTE